MLLSIQPAPPHARRAAAVVSSAWISALAEIGLAFLAKDKTLAALYGRDQLSLDFSTC
jgi:hypothetical protein